MDRNKTLRPPSDILFGPKATYSWNIWSALMKAFATKYSIRDETNIGCLNGDQCATKAMEQLWDDWIEGDEVEIRANFGVSSPNKPGAPFDIKQGSLQQALASREAKCMQKTLRQRDGH